MFFRIKTVGSHQYLQIVHSVREGKKGRQRVLGALGRFDELKASGRLDALMRSGLRHCENFAVIDAHKAGETEPVAVRRIGPDLVFARLWKKSGIPEALQSTLKDRRYEFDVERAIYLTVLHRLFATGSDRAAERWRENYLIPGTEALELHHLYRAMAFLGDPIEQLEKPTGAVRCTKDLIEESLFDSRRDLFTEVDLVFFDTTSLYFEGEGGQSIGKRGHNKDHRPDLKQMVVGMAVDVQGRPMCCEMWPGNTADVTTLVPIVQRMRERFRLGEITVVADRGMVSKATLELFEKSDPPVHYVIGVRMRRQKEVNLSVLDSCEPWFESVPERSNAKDPSPLKVKEVWVENRRYIVCLNEEERRKDAHDREAIVAHLKEQLRRGDKSLVGNKGYRRFLKVEGKDHFALDEEQIEADARYDGLWVLRTNTVYNVETVAHVYKNLWTVEAIFRTTKSILETRPIYHRWNETICGHVFCSFLALLLKHDLESRMRQAGMQWEWAEVIRGLDNLHQVEANFQGRSFLLRSQLQAHASAAIRASGVALPPTLREL
ncbi:MAG TPA: IS1634 family transposase [Chthoniobacterales bacterium]